MNARLSNALADRYRIERELGQGGMATVYLAEDLKHKRLVALKVLKPELAAVLGADRFVQEITTTAALQHPHILPLFDSGTADGFLFYVMPFIDGETLRSKLDRETQLGIDESVRIACEVADALDYAHRHGVIHRDIKPENILLHDGRATVADFGIAIAVSAAAGGRMTETGLSLGTPHYMSPEQATAEKEIGNRADIYSLGSVLYEMLGGEPPHVGHSAQQIIMRIIAEEVQPISKLRKSVPLNVAAAVGKSVEKLPADRFDSARAFADALRNPSFRTSESAPPDVWHANGVSRRDAVALGAVVVALIALSLAGWLRPSPAPVVMRYGLAFAPGQAMIPGSPTPAPAPDGSFLVYIGPAEMGEQLWIKRRENYLATPIPGTLGAQSFTVSPDGKWIGFAASGQVKKVAVAGGAVMSVVTDSVGSVYGLAWLEDGTIIYVRRGAAGLMRVDADAGVPSILWLPDSSLSTFAPVPIAGGRGFAFVVCTLGCPESQLWIYDLKSDSARLLIRGAVPAGYVHSGQLVYYTESRTVFALPFDSKRLKATGTATPLGDQLATSYGRTLVNVSASGTIVEVVGGTANGLTYEMVWVDRNGLETPIDTAWTFQLTAVARNHGWSLSPDGSKIAIGLNSDGDDGIWVKPLPRGAPYRVSFDPRPDMRPRWTSDSRFVTYIASHAPGGLYRHRADGTGTDSILFEGVVDEGVVTPDNQWILLRRGSIGAAAGGRNITGLRIGVDKKPVAVLATEFDEEAVAISPDGKWLAYQSDETGRTEVFVRPFPNTDGGKKQVSSRGGLGPVWSRDGQQLFFLDEGHNMMSARMVPGPTIDLTEPVTLFHVRDELLAVEALYYTPWDVARDGRFLMARLVGKARDQESTIVIVENWIEELKAKARAKR